MIRIVTDSSADIPSHVADRLGITVIPMRIRIGSKTLRDGVDIDRSEIYRHFSRTAAHPVSEPPLQQEFQQVYGQLLSNADQILSIHLSGRVNRTVHHAQEVAKAFIGRSKITVVDSRVFSCGLELLVTAAAEAAQAGASMEEIVRIIRGMIPHIYMVFFVESLDQLERQGFLGRGRMYADGGLGGRPLLIVEDGEITALDRVRTRGKSVDRLFEFVSEFAHFGRVTILQGRLADEAQLLFQRLNEAFPDKPLEVRPYGVVLATILGPDAVGVGVYDRG